MAYIPEDTKWYLGDLVVEIRVQGDPRNVVHINTVLIRADSLQEAYDKAVILGEEHNSEYTNMDGKTVTIRFQGLNELSAIHDELEHGAELIYQEKVNVGSQELQTMVLPKQMLGVFTAGFPDTDKPDYGSAEVISEALARIHEDLDDS